MYFDLKRGPILEEPKVRIQRGGLRRSYVIWCDGCVLKPIDTVTAKAVLSSCVGCDGRSLRDVEHINDGYHLIGDFRWRDQS